MKKLVSAESSRLLLEPRTRANGEGEEPKKNRHLETKRTHMRKRQHTGKTLMRENSRDESKKIIFQKEATQREHLNGGRGRKKR